MSKFYSYRFVKALGYPLQYFYPTEYRVKSVVIYSVVKLREASQVSPSHYTLVSYGLQGTNNGEILKARTPILIPSRYHTFNFHLRFCLAVPRPYCLRVWNRVTILTSKKSAILTMAAAFAPLENVFLPAPTPSGPSPLPASTASCSSW